uniref:Cnidarian restricted protein n=1 Tax=Clytia hemisphaerica TaxID=252671 RepID=A0A7M5WVN7_9CNID
MASFKELAFAICVLCCISSSECRPAVISLGRTHITSNTITTSIGDKLVKKALLIQNSNKPNTIDVESHLVTATQSPKPLAPTTGPTTQNIGSQSTANNEVPQPAQSGNAFIAKFCYERIVKTTKTVCYLTKCFPVTQTRKVLECYGV